MQRRDEIRAAVKHLLASPRPNGSEAPIVHPIEVSPSVVSAAGDTGPTVDVSRHALHELEAVLREHGIAAEVSIAYHNGIRLSLTLSPIALSPERPHSE